MRKHPPILGLATVALLVWILLAVVGNVPLRGQGGSANGNNYPFPGSVMTVNSQGGLDLPNNVAITSHVNTGAQVTLLRYANVGGSGTQLGQTSDGVGLAPSARFKIQDQGQCTMTSGACSAQSFLSTYGVAPLIFLQWTGTGTCAGPLKYTDTTTTVTPASNSGTDTCQVSWFAFGN